ncbi:MAG: biotin--[acetyl-CoA-carboxylase] ligase [Candidatus Thermoplasmatota archaeon]|jgi:BirA family biotin operon repressor/biotin-[acetyl-CoA-carboxylase] ligase|nr:biotin--[acetyl-CoA-carboxylase] ligase [Candidatus Thermoplasmatota archaeon]
MSSEIKTKILELLNKNDFLPFNKIKENINVPSNDILKQIKYLKKIGYEIDFVKNKGYHLISKPDIIIPQEITLDLDTDIIGKEILYFKSINSTNDYAKKIAEKRKKEGIVIVADIQTKGRGRKNRVWFSSSGGLWFSIVLRPKIPANYGMFLTMIASISVVQAIKKLTGISPVIKWPNDVLINGKKVCGILTEFDVKKNLINYAVVGIGININNKINKQIKKIATSLSIEVGVNISRIKFLKTIIKCFDKYYKNLNIYNFIKIKNLWSLYAKIIGKKVKIMENGNTLTGIISDVDNYGFLILKTKDAIYKISNGDIIIYE